jgi:hypothetical protein
MIAGCNMSPSSVKFLLLNSSSHRNSEGVADISDIELLLFIVLLFYCIYIIWTYGAGTYVMSYVRGFADCFLASFIISL